MYPLSEAVWKKSTRSGGNGGQCVEVAGNMPGIVAVRDSKDPSGPVLVVDPLAFKAFTTAIRSSTL
ncbi:MAG TPA: DUF397 domain-containing protein [Actinocatenispora sp.]